MGNYFSRRNQRNNVPSTISYFTNSFGLYFGPYFIMNRNENRNTNPVTRNLINEQVQNNIMTGTGLLWSDLLEAIENGVITEQELSDFGISFGQTQISEYDAPITIQSLVNLHKHSIKIAKVEYENKNIQPEQTLEEKKPLNNNISQTNNDECVIQIDSLMNENSNYCNNKNCRVALEFEYDSYTPCQVHLFWNSREVIVKNGNERKAIYLLNHNENRNSMTIGPLPAGNNQKFVLPNVINIPADVLDDIIKQTNEIDLSTSKKSSGEPDIPDANRNNNNDDNTVDINSEDNNNTTNNNNNNNNNENNENNASTSGNVNNDGSSRLRIGRNMFNHRRRSSSRSTSRSNKKDKKEKKIIWYPLIIVLESLEKKDEKVDDHSIKYQTTFLKLEISNETNQYNIKSIDQKVMIKNNLYRLQEIYGFTDETDAEEVVTNEVNSSIECVICLSEPRNTIVLPCRHLCVCQDCADILCNQSRHDRRSNYLNTPRCPICRQIFHSFLRINMNYFNLTEDSYEKSINGKHNGSGDDISAAKGKKGDNLTAEKKYNIIATSRMTEDDENENEEEKEEEVESKQNVETLEKIKEDKEEDKEEDYNKSIFEDTNSDQNSKVKNTVEITEVSQGNSTENIVENNHEEKEKEKEKENVKEKEKAECYSEHINDSNYSNDDNSNRDDNSYNNISNADGPNSQSVYLSLDPIN